MEQMITWRAERPHVPVRVPVALAALSASALAEGWAVAQWWPASLVALVASTAALWGWLAATAVEEAP